MPQRFGPTRGVPRPVRAANDYWYVVWSEGRRSKRESLGTKEEETALTRFAQWILLDGRTRTGDEGSVDFTLKEVWGFYLKKHVLRHVTGQATIHYAWANLEPHFGLLTVPDFNQDQVDRYVEKRSSGRLGRKAKSITIRRELATLIAALNFCASPASKMIAKAALNPIKLPSAGEPRDRWLRMEEMQRLLTAAAEMRRGDRLSRCERFLWLALETAARKQAILDLTWSRVDFAVGVISYDVPGRVKTKKRRASVPISAALRPVLERAYSERDKDNKEDLVLDNKGAVWKSIQLVAVRAGFSTQEVKRGEKPKATGISPHVLRHSAATAMARNGVPLWQIAMILGNSVGVVEKVYAKWAPDDPGRTVNLISGGVLLAPPEKKIEAPEEIV